MTSGWKCRNCSLVSNEAVPAPFSLPYGFVSYAFLPILQGCWLLKARSDPPKLPAVRDEGLSSAGKPHSHLSQWSPDQSPLLRVRTCWSWHRQRLRFFLKIATPWNHIDPDFSISRPLRFRPTEVKSLRDCQGKANPHRTDVGNGLQFILSFFQPHISYYFVHGEFITL